MHAKLLGEFGGLPGLPRAELLQSSLARPQQLLAYGEPPPSIAQLAAAYGFALARNHCFSDGNKRIALAVIDVFLRINGSGLSATEEDVADGKNVFEFGTGSYIPTLVLPVDESVRFELRSPDVIHSFWITGFLYKEDVIPGRVNEFVVTPNKVGTYQGKCAELCGSYHSRMLFNVEVVTREEYDAYLQDQIDAGFWSDEVLMGNQETVTQAGLETEIPEGGTE